MAKVKELKRIKQVLENDRLGISGNCKEVLKRDILDLLGNYFELCSNLEIKIESCNNGYNIFIVADAMAFKGFKLITN